MTEQQKVTWLASCSHFITHGFMTLFPAVMVIIAAENSMSLMDIGIIANIGYFLYGLGAFPAGYLSDKYGSKRMLTIGIFGMSFTSILVGVSLEAWSFGLSYAILGCFASIHHPAGLSFIARRVTENKGKALGVHGVMGNVGLFATPLFAALCVMFFDSWRSAYIIYGGIGLGFALLLYFSRIHEEEDLSFGALLNFAKRKSLTPKYQKQGAVELEGDVLSKVSRGDIFYMVPIALLVLYLGSVLSGFIFRGSLTYFPVLFKEEILFVANHDEPVVIAGFMTTAVLSIGLIGAWFGGWVNDKLDRPEFLPAIIFAGVAPLLFLVSRFSGNKLILVSLLFSLIYYAWQPAQNYLIAKYTKKSSHGMGFGVNFFLIFGVGSIATATGGFVSDNFGVDIFYRILSMVSFAAMCTGLVVFFVRKSRIRFSLQVEKRNGKGA